MITIVITNHEISIHSLRYNLEDERTKFLVAGLLRKVANDLAPYVRSVDSDGRTLAGAHAD